jgi:type I restriction enzyme M protein
MLVEMANVVREHGGDARTLKLSGQEVSLTTAAIARMNLFLHGIEGFRIRRGDTLRDPKFKTVGGHLERFDLGEEPDSAATADDDPAGVTSHF